MSESTPISSFVAHVDAHEVQLTKTSFIFRFKSDGCQLLSNPTANLALFSYPFLLDLLLMADHRPPWKVGLVVYGNQVLKSISKQKVSSHLSM